MFIAWWKNNNHRVSVCGFTECQWVSSCCTSVVLKLFFGLSMSEDNLLLQLLGIKCFYISLMCSVIFFCLLDSDFFFIKTVC